MPDTTSPASARRPVIGAPRAAPVSAPSPAAAPAPSRALVRTRASLASRMGQYEPAEWLAPALRDLTELSASDVHLTRNGITGNLIVDARVDGDLERVIEFNGDEAKELLTRLKTAAKLVTSSSRVPGDGKYELAMNGYPYRVRAVSLPLFDGGEKVVLRLPSIGKMKLLDTIGFTTRNLTATRSLIARPGGLTLIAGPMGEGKTTTAHGVIMDIGTEGKAVITVEDPVERVLEGVSQIEVNESNDTGFGAIMRYLVRSDFDTLFVGEIRDSITAAAAVQIAKAGRRVISTIHATDNVTALLRLIELSEDAPLTVLDAVSGVISQRLVRKLHPDGGFEGRYPIHEVLALNDDLTDQIIAGKSLGGIRSAAAETSTTFAENLRELIVSGITDLSEARRVAGNVL